MKNKPEFNRLTFIHAMDGIREAIRTQFNFRIHVLAALLVVAAGLVLRISLTQWCILMLAGGMVLAAECFNTAVEYLVDLVMPGLHKKAGKAKDLAAGAVLICAIAAAVVGMMIFVPALYNLF